MNAIGQASLPANSGLNGGCEAQPQEGEPAQTAGGFVQLLQACFSTKKPAPKIAQASASEPLPAPPLQGRKSEEGKQGEGGVQPLVEAAAIQVAWMPCLSPELPPQQNMPRLLPAEGRNDGLQKDVFQDSPETSQGGGTSPAAKPELSEAPPPSLLLGLPDSQEVAAQKESPQTAPCHGEPVEKPLVNGTKKEAAVSRATSDESEEAPAQPDGTCGLSCLEAKNAAESLNPKTSAETWRGALRWGEEEKNSENAPISPQKAEDLLRKAPAGPQPERGGISSALDYQRMVTHAETEKLAEGGLQNVPAATHGRENPTLISSPLNGEKSAPQLAQGVPEVGQIWHALETQGGGLKEGMEAQPVRMARLATEIQEMAVELLHFKADSMSVLIRPDAETALHLRMTVIAGRVYAEARLQSGDGAWLQSAWGDLQRVLAEQNIVMEPLKYSSFHPSAGHWGEGRQPQRDAQSPTASEAPEPAAVLTPAEGRLAPRKRRTATGWEWWA